MDGGVGSLAGTIFHLWHGSIDGRGHGKRHDGLNRFGFDPTTDLRSTVDGPWRWNSDKHELHEYVGAYFVSRAEDG